MQGPTADYIQTAWAPAAKDMVGTSLASSRLWFTIAQGIVTEVYYPRIDIPQIKDLGFIIADDRGFWVELRRNGDYQVALAGPGVPAVTITHKHARFTFTMEVCTSQRRDALLVRYRLEGDTSLRPYALLSPRLGGEADYNHAWVDRHAGRVALWAEQGPYGLALLAVDANGADAWQRCSAGGYAVSDGWQDFHQHGRMTWQYDSAGPAAVALMGELPAQGALALGLGTSKEAAATLATSALMIDFDVVWNLNRNFWESWLATGKRPSIREDIDAALTLSASILKVHEDRTYCGAAVASLSVPWGETSRSRGGYHLVWPRDLVETAGALIAMQAYEDARDVLRYLIATQQPDGHWFQNQWLGGTAFWQGIQLDEAAFPVLLAGALHEQNELGNIPVTDMVTRAIGFIAREGPATAQDRWEEDAGLNTFTLAAAIAALVEGSAFLDAASRDFALRLADCWNAHLEDWAFVSDTELSRQLGVSGYYIRTVPADVLTRDMAQMEPVATKNLAHDPNLPANARIATDFLQLVRYGLRLADDPAIRDTVTVTDRLLKVDTPAGPTWHRYNDDGYGEHADGSAFDGTGIGRGWPLLTGERGHYALCAGEDVMPYIEAMLAMASPLGLIPEQVWDSAPIPELGLAPGRPSGSAMPLLWAHSEFIKLCCGYVLGRPVDRPAATWARYAGKRPVLDHEVWGPTYQPRNIPAGTGLSIALKAPARVHWGVNGWLNAADADTRPIGLGIHLTELPIATMRPGETVQFTLRWRDTEQWDGTNYALTIVA